MTFNSPKIAESSKPGQFVMVNIGTATTFLRRPFSICKTNKKTFDILYKVVGCGTEELSKKKSGDSLNIIGPLGNGYKFPILEINKTPILVAGGTGVASLLFFAQKIKEKYKSVKPIVFIGAKNKKEVLLKNEYEKLGFKVIVSTEDGSMGKKGLISNLLSSYLEECCLKQVSAIYSCGPKAMLKEISKIAKKNNVDCFVSLEEYMVCGIGTCMGCVTKTIKNLKTCPELVAGLKIKNEGNNYEYKSVCKDGPVFDAKDIIW
ncbi:MAG: hypothetical protein A2539_05115 [Elusimicrobia bacterium RIFOXYD2_FULL_34_15]|nr:MAG: hypothetical protein A2539_05115 [Elusimicrobia bacterium RIFOXYD2_FULL_34_15]